MAEGKANRDGVRVIINDHLTDLQTESASLDIRSYAIINVSNLLEEFKFNLEIKNKTFDSLNVRLDSLMKLADGRVTEVQPLLRYVDDKIATYRESRQHDSVTLVGSFGNGLFFPEKNEDGPFLLELDILYNRKMPHVVLPTKNSPVVTVQIDPEPIRTLPLGSCLLEVTQNTDRVAENARHWFFSQLENNKTYLKSTGFTCFIPERDGPTILDEKEINDIGQIEVLPLYRTFRTEKQKTVLDGKEFSFRVLIDKVFALGTMASFHIQLPESGKKMA